MQMERLLNQHLSSYFVRFLYIIFKIMTTDFDLASLLNNRDYQGIR